MIDREVIDIKLNSAPPGTGAETFAIDPETFRQLGYRAVDLATDYLAGMRQRAVFTPMLPDERRVLLEQSFPDGGVDPDEILDRFAELVLPHPMGNGHPRFFGWANSPPSPIGTVAEFLAGAMGPSCAGGDHAAIYLERCVVRWLMELVGFPVEGSMGLLVSGGSMASLTCLAAARQRAVAAAGHDVRTDGLQGWPSQLTMYLSTEAHTTLRKAAELLGLGSAAVRMVPVDDAFRINVTALRKAIQADRAAGRQPYCVVASAGTVSTGAIDPFSAIADLCAEEELWLHVDGAIGAVGILDPAVAPRYTGLERADSLALDPHKWLSVPMECGCALVRDGQLLRDTFSLVPPYVRTEEGKGFGGLPWYAEYGFQQSRGFRALKVWMTMLQAGRDGLATMIARHNALARHLAAIVDAAPDFERAAPVELSIVCFRYVPPALDLSDEELDALNKAIMEAVQAGGEAFLTQAVLHGRFVLRANVLHYATTTADVDTLVEIIRRTGARLATAIR
jgi:glutamate/tyrosine decarboxylase-like PLP-dependent enzyme